MQMHLLVDDNLNSQLLDLMKQLDVNLSPPAFVRNPYLDNSHKSMSYTTTPSYYTFGPGVIPCHSSQFAEGPCADLQQIGTNDME